MPLCRQFCDLPWAPWPRPLSPAPVLTIAPVPAPICLQKAYNEAKAKREGIGLDRMAPKFPLPPVDDEQERQLMEELPQRQQLSGEAGRLMWPPQAWFPACCLRCSLGAALAPECSSC